MKDTNETNTFELDFVCEWCAKDVMDLVNISDDMDYITLSHSEDHVIQLCHSCYITAIQALQFGKEVVQDCQTHGNGRRIYVAVEAVGEQNELVNALVWPNTLLGDSARSAKRNSITYRVSQD